MPGRGGRSGGMDLRSGDLVVFRRNVVQRGSAIVRLRQPRWRRVPRGRAASGGSRRQEVRDESSDQGGSEIALPRRAVEVQERHRGEKSWTQKVPKAPPTWGCARTATG